MSLLRPVYFCEDDCDSNEGQSDLESGKRKKRSATGWRAMHRYFLRQFHRSSKLNTTGLLGLVLVVGMFLLVVFYLKEEGVLPAGVRPTQALRMSPEVYPYSHLKNMVMVAGHAVYTSKKCAKANEENSWFLEPYQKHSGQAASFLEHIHRGVAAAARDDQSMLVFSGGETRREAGPKSEAQSYWSVADSNDWFGHASSVRERALTEEHARDSFENLLFSICRFRELTGNYPVNITVVSYTFKERRFVGLHRAALNFPEEHFTYIGTVPAVTSASAAAKGELQVQEQFRRDPYGCSGPLREKRLKRDPFLRLIPYPSGCPEISDLFTHCGPSFITRRLPWN